MTILSWTINYGNNDLRDYFTLHDTEQHAKAYADTLIANADNLHCWAISKVTQASEPHWTEEVTS